jgi:hypothetical protein
MEALLLALFQVERALSLVAEVLLGLPAIILNALGFGA